MTLAGFDFYHNPIKRGLYLKFNEDRIIKNIEIRSMRGESLIYKEINSKFGNVYINLNSGMYIVEVVKDDDTHVVKKLIVN